MSKEYQSPLVSIGMPVFNGEKYLRLALESLINQNYKNFELIISDNCSTDLTSEICHEYQVKDSRIRYYRNDSNIGAAKNFAKVFELSSGKYFMWAAHDDLWEKTYIEKCVLKLKECPEAVLCCTEIKFINDAGNEVPWEYSNMESIGKSFPERVHDLISRMGWFAIYGLIRPEILKKTLYMYNEYGMDVLILMQLLLHGSIAKVPEKLFYYRLPNQSKTPRKYMQDINPYHIEEKIKTPYTDMAKNLYKIVIESDYDTIIKEQIKKDFIYTISFQNPSWRSSILTEMFNDLSLGVDESDVPAIIEQVIQGSSNIPEPRPVLENIKTLVGSRPLFIWGAGKSGKNVSELFTRLGVKISGFIDKNQALVNTEIQGITVFSPLILEQTYDSKSKPYIIIASLYFKEISNELHAKGYQHNRDYKIQDFNSPFILLS